MKEGIKAKRPGYIRFYPERWIFGSTRDEMTNAERAVWMDFLALAYMNDPPGQIDFTSLKRLANQLNISKSLLSSTIQKAIDNQKIRVIKYIVDQKTNEKLEEFELNYDQLEIKSADLPQGRLKNGIALYTIFILKWSEYQSEYLRQKPYRKKENKPDKNPENPTPKPVTQVTSKGEERRKEEKRGDEKTEEFPTIQQNPEPQSPLPSNSINSSRGKTIKEEFLSKLRNCTEYPYDEDKDSLLFDLTVQDYPEINILEQLSRKIEWWKEHPEALKADTRKQLEEWFKGEHEFKKRGGPQAIGEIKGISDPDDRSFYKKLLMGLSEKKRVPDN